METGRIVLILLLATLGALLLLALVRPRWVLGDDTGWDTSPVTLPPEWVALAYGRRHGAAEACRRENERVARGTAAAPRPPAGPVVRDPRIPRVGPLAATEMHDRRTPLDRHRSGRLRRDDGAGGRGTRRATGRDGRLPRFSGGQGGAGRLARQGRAGRGEARLGGARHGWAGRGAAGRGEARRGWARRGKARLGEAMNRRRAAQTWTPDDLDVAYREVEDAQDAALAALYAEALPPERLERPEPDLDALARDYWGEDA